MEVRFSERIAQVLRRKYLVVELDDVLPAPPVVVCPENPEGFRLHAGESRAVDYPVHDADFAAPEPIDHLLLVADDEKGAAFRQRIFDQHLQVVPLEQARVLKFVYEEVGYAFAELEKHLRHFHVSQQLPDGQVDVVHEDDAVLPLQHLDFAAQQLEELVVVVEARRSMGESGHLRCLPDLVIQIVDVRRQFASFIFDHFPDRIFVEITAFGKAVVSFNEFSEPFDRPLIKPILVGLHLFEEFRGKSSQPFQQVIVHFPCCEMVGSACCSLLIEEF